MRRTALYSRSVPREAPATARADASDAVSTAAPAATPRASGLRRFAPGAFARRHERWLILLVGLVAGALAFGWWQATRPAARLLTQKDIDGAVPGDLQSKYVPNFGAGLYYHNTRFFIGASAPRLLRNSIDLAEDDVEITREISHFYVTAGMRWDLNANLQFQPQVLLKYVQDAPFEGDANANFIFMNKFTAGVSYRLGGSKRSGIGEAIGLIGGIQATDLLFIGLSYDYTLSEIRYTTGGSIEAVVRYCIGGQSDDAAEFVSPRFF